MCYKNLLSEQVLGSTYPKNLFKTKILRILIKVIVNNWNHTIVWRIYFDRLGADSTGFRGESFFQC
jgi:hypothetical protein